MDATKFYKQTLQVYREKLVVSRVCWKLNNVVSLGYFIAAWDFPVMALMLAEDITIARELGYLRLVCCTRCLAAAQLEDIKKWVAYLFVVWRFVVYHFRLSSTLCIWMCIVCHLDNAVQSYYGRNENGVKVITSSYY